MTAYEHVTVMLQEMISMLAVQSGDIAIDCTVGGGGHTASLLKNVGPTGSVLGFDRDASAIQHASVKFADEIAAGRLQLFHKPFSSLKETIQTCGLLGKVAAIGADIGVSSVHLDQPERGFSLQKDGPLDMRMDQSSNRTAKDLVNNESVEELTQIFKTFGEEPKAYHFARAIVREREKKPFLTTLELAEFIKRVSPYASKSKKHPATKIFQALRIATNQELDELNLLLTDGWSCLKTRGRLGVISFHSLEDRMVKEFMVENSVRGKKKNLLRGLPMRESEINELVPGLIIKPFPCIPSDRELNLNVRARSAHLRVMEKNFH